MGLGDLFRSRPGLRRRIHLSRQQDEKAEAAYYYGYVSAALIGEYAEADRVYAEYQLGPERGELYYLYLISRADVHLHRNRPQQALADVDEALADGDLSPIYRQIALYHRAVALQALGRGVDSRATLRQVVAMDADSGLRAVASAMLGE
jgi:tetratricopeptide (TPR) repeat protein